MTDLAFTSSGVRDVAESLQSTVELIPQQVVAIIAPDPLTFGIVRMWEAIINADQWTTATFRTLDDAKAWLREMLPNQVIE